MLTIGLTGGVASGKTIAARAFAALGAPVCDADQVARAVVVKGEPALEAIAAEFGTGALRPDGELDRPFMRRIVFGDPAARKRLEAITHPAIRARLLAFRDAQAAAGAPYAVLDVAILIEAGFDRLVDRILVIDVPPEVQVARLIARDGIDGGLAREMLAAQASREQRLARAHDVISNTGTPAELEQAVRDMDTRYRALATGA